MIFRLLFLSLLVSSFCFGDIIIMKNGQKITIPGVYAVKGKFIRYRDKNNELLQLPLSLVDLVASAKATRLAEELASRVAPVKKEEKAKRSLADIAEDLDRFREEDYEPPTEVSIDSKGVQKYHVETTNTSHPDSLLTPEMSGQEVVDMSKDFNIEYNRLADEIEKIDQEIQTTKQSIVGFQDQNNFGDDFRGTAYENMVRYEKRLEELKTQRREKYSHLQKVKSEARQTGDKSTGRKRSVKMLKEESSDEDDMKYRADEGEFKYKEDSPR